MTKFFEFRRRGAVALNRPASGGAVGGRLAVSGALVAQYRPARGRYAAGRGGGLVLPRGIGWRAKLRTWGLELELRARLACKGLVRGLMGSGVLGVGRLYATVYRVDGRIEDLGLLSTRVVTNAGVTFLRDDFNNNAQDVTNFNYHGCGTGATAEAAGDTALVTESTTALNPDSTRATGTRSTPASNQFQTVGTVTFDASAAITEHGIFSQSATGGGTLWDRSVFSAINVASGDSIQFTYVLTLSAGG